MWVRMRKELRELLSAGLPVYGVTALLAALAAVAGSTLVPLVCFAILCFVVASQPLGLEVERGTLGLLLAQPISRTRLWWEKHLLAALLPALGLLALLGLFVFLGLPLRETWVGGLVLLVAVAGGGHWAVILGGSQAAAWVAAAVPMALYLLLATVASLVAGEPTLPRPEWLLLSYGLALAVWSLTKFRRLQFTGQKRRASIAPAGMGSIRWKGWKTLRQTLELLRKEVRLQASSVWLVVAVVVAWFGCLQAAAAVQAAGSNSTRDVVGVAAHLLAFISNLLVPFLIGANAVAAERRAGVLGWQLALPVALHHSWRAKRRVALALTAVVTVASIVGFSRFLKLQLFPFRLPEVESWIGSAWATPPLALTALALGIFGSRHAGSPLRAIGAGVVCGVGVFSIWQLAALILWPVQMFSLHLLVYFGPLMLLALLMLRQPAAEEWLGGRPLARTAALLLWVPVLLGVQLVILDRTALVLEREISEQEAKFLTLGVEDPESILGLDQDLESFARQLLPIIDFESRKRGQSGHPGEGFRLAPGEEHTMVIGREDGLFLGHPNVGFWRFQTSSMKLAAHFDGVELGLGTASRRFWRHEFMYWLRSTPEAEYRRPLRMRLLSLAPFYHHHHRQNLLDQRMRQGIALVALVIVQRMEPETRAAPELQALIEASTLRDSLARPSP